MFATIHESCNYRILISQFSCLFVGKLIGGFCIVKPFCPLIIDDVGIKAFQGFGEGIEMQTVL